MCDVAEDVSGSELARALGVDPRTVQRWHASGAIRPAWTTPGGWHRWNIDDVRRQLGMDAERPATPEQG
ncbi:MerR family transcriptional regulator [Actinomycetospora soli]|uniref:MerR family transcriptional regulator n=1 Tax=Actinomycetospora soli TaxID=2893887 RepID=UPI001E2CC6FF|nr:MerR family transcriptional regulator [Actinomycetospora soli]MCD2191655.1 MerR family transcriptional regulator [Actinomycetospora soli]